MNGNGYLTVDEIESELNALRIPWQQVTGLTRSQLHKLIDIDKTGTIDILDFLGEAGLTPRPPWSSLPPLEQWEEYSSKILELDLLNLEPSKPLWWSDETQEGLGRPGTSTVKTRIPTNTVLCLLRNCSSIPLMEKYIRCNTAPSDSSRRRADTSFLAREDLDYIQTKVRRVEKFLKDFNENKRELAKLRTELQNVTEAEERKAEFTKKKEQEEEEQRKAKQQAGMALVMSDTGDKRSIFGASNKVELTQFKKPKDFVDYFDIENIQTVDNHEVEYRMFLKSLGVSVVLGDRIKRIFSDNCSQAQEATRNSTWNQHGPFSGSLNEAEFGRVLSILLNVEIPQSRMKQLWISASNGGSAPVELFSFITWYNSTTF
jgi:hypothetical protein